MKKILSLSIITLLPFLSFSQTYVPGQIYYDSTRYVEYRAGNLPIILSSPHGGNLQPSNIPDRNCSGCVYLKDSWTKEITEGLYNKIMSETGCYPHVIINLLHRKKFDANRDIIDAADGNPTVEIAWQTYHDFIDSAKNQIVEDYGRGLFLDMHGHAHTIQRIELGYLLSKNELQLPDTTLNTDFYIEKSSIRALVGQNIQNFLNSELLRGQYSFGTIMDDKGFPCVPSSSDPFPQGSEPYFNGGYNTQRHGSRDNNGEIDGIQIEMNQGIRFDSIIREILIDSLASSINKYIDYHYNNQYINNYCGLILGVPENNDIDLKLYPNPTTDYFYLSGEINNAELSVFNNIGQKVLSEHWSKDKVNVELLPSGLYFVRIVKNNITMDIIKLIKE
jgi:N-formylglutamate amidohydrolase